jgi:hypothetical protein
MSNVIPLGITHDPGCTCRRCLNEAYRTAKAEVTEAMTRYQSIRTSNARPEAISRARQRWTETRQFLILAEHALRAAEDEERIEQRENQRVDGLRWKPKEAL